MENRFIAASLACLLMSSTATAAQWLNGKDIAYVFAGREITGTYSNAAPFTEVYHKNSTIDYQEGTTQVKGRWKIEGAIFCTDYYGLPGGCFKIAAQGTNCFEFWLLDETGNLKDKTWIARGWQARYRPTCPTP